MIQENNHSSGSGAEGTYGPEVHKLFVEEWTEATVVATYATLGEEEGKKEFNLYATVAAGRVLGLYAIAHPEAKVQFDSIEFEEPCEEHPETGYIFVNIIVEE